MTLWKPAAPARHALSSALAISLWATAASAAEAPADAPHPTDLDAVVVTANPLGNSAEALAHPVEVLYGEALDRSKSATLGDTVSRLPGVQTTYFGPGVGRPIIRGQEGPRVQVLSGGIGSLDASTVSADHAVGIEPFLADQIEVLKGPGTLLFGSGAIGGAVNVVDGRLADSIPDAPLGGRAELRGNTVNDERTGMFRLDGVNGNWVIHVDGLVRNTGDYDIPGVAILEHEHDHEEEEEHEDEAQVAGRLNNSSLKTRAGALGTTWLGEQGFFGLSVNTYRTNYGIPNGAHVHSDEHDHEGEEEEGHAHEEEGSVRIDLAQNRIDLKAGIYEPLSFLQSLNLRATHTDYEHVEIEGGTPATRFSNKGMEGRLEGVQKEWNGWRGAAGLQFAQADFAAIGDEAFVPSTKTSNLGVFVIQEKDFASTKLELGARHERVQLDPQGHDSRRFNITSLSSAAIWHLNPDVDLRFGLDHSERAPTTEELFAAGPHVATRSLEIGDENLDKERALRAEIGLHAHTDRVDLKLAIYRTNFKDFIYLADTGIEEEGLPVRLWAQEDASFTGAEAEALFHLADTAVGFLDLRVFGDYVRAKLDGSGTRTVEFEVPHGDHAHHYDVELATGGNLPRIAPARFGADLNWSLDGWRASLGAIRYGKQDRVAENEETSPGYTLVNAHLAYRWDRNATNSWEVFLDGNNLTNREVRPHTSLLRDYAPLPGRGVAFGLRAYF
jgi:iron complex outermembrane receptor protein